MKIEYLADRIDAVETIAQWYYNEWGWKDPSRSVEGTRDGLLLKLNRTVLPIPVVATEGDTILGCGQLKEREMDIYPDKEFWIGGIFVAPEMRRRGVGAIIVKNLLQLATDLGIENIHLQTESENESLYIALGFHRTDFVEYKKVKVAVMVRALK